MLVVVGITIPMLVLALYLFRLGPRNIDYTPFSFLYTGIVIIYGLLRYDFLPLSPVTYETIFNSVDEAVLVTDDMARCCSLIMLPSVSSHRFRKRVSVTLSVA